MKKKFLLALLTSTITATALLGVACSKKNDEKREMPRPMINYSAPYESDGYASPSFEGGIDGNAVMRAPEFLIGEVNVIAPKPHFRKGDKCKDFRKDDGVENGKDNGKEESDNGDSVVLPKKDTKDIK